MRGHKHNRGASLKPAEFPFKHKRVGMKSPKRSKKHHGRGGKRS